MCRRKYYALFGKDYVGKANMYQMSERYCDIITHRAFRSTGALSYSTARQFAHLLISNQIIVFHCTDINDKTAKLHRQLSNDVVRVEFH